MAMFQDASIGIGAETVYGTGVTVDHWCEFSPGETIKWTPQIVQGQGLRVATTLDVSARRAYVAGQGGGDVQIPLLSKGQGLLWKLLAGAATSTLVSGSTYQVLATLLRATVENSATLQKGVINLDSTVDCYTHVGVTCDQFKIDMPNSDIASVTGTLRSKDVGTATAYTAPTMPAESAGIFHFANLTVGTGTLTEPTATTLASATTALANVRDASVTVNRNAGTRMNAGGGGRQAAPSLMRAAVSGSMTVENSATFRDAILNQTAMPLVWTYTAGALSSGLETFQLVLPECKFRGDVAQVADMDVPRLSLTFDALHNGAYTTDFAIVLRTSDNAL